ncbi:MAG TPA: hypothetical protein VKW04_06225 [Planctomycetota bacterium]|nr:hypothetical protein [Planctomycetota bacterium]
MFVTGARPQDYETTDLFGNARRLHEFRRKAHVVLICDPAATPDERSRWTQRRAAEAQRWTWLQAEALVPATPLEGVDPGTYLISRWGYVIAIHPPGAWDMDRIERDLLTFESQDCCDLTKAP